MKSAKTKLSTSDLTRYRAMLLKKRAELVADVTAMDCETVYSESGDISHAPTHLADRGTDSSDQDTVRLLAEADRRLVWEIDEALERIESKTYGICEQSGDFIPKSRLDAAPWARYTIEAAREIEASGGT